MTEVGQSVQWQSRDGQSNGQSKDVTRVETLLEQDRQSAIKNGQSTMTESGNQEWTIQRRYQSRVECTMTEVAIKNGQSRDVTRVGQSVQ